MLTVCGPRWAASAESVCVYAGERALCAIDAVRGEAPLDGLLFSQLTTAVGAHAVFCHHGCCEHKLVVKDVRLPHPADVRNRALYPLLVMHGKKPERKCQVRPPPRVCMVWCGPRAVKKSRSHGRRLPKLT